MKKVFLIMTFIIALSANAGITNNAIIGWQYGYRKVDITAVPIDVLKAVSDKYGGYSVSEAMMSEENEYRLILKKEGKSLTVHYESSGEFIKEEMK